MNSPNHDSTMCLWSKPEGHHTGRVNKNPGAVGSGDLNKGGKKLRPELYLLSEPKCFVGFAEHTSSSDWLGKQSWVKKFSKPR